MAGSHQQSSKLPRSLLMNLTLLERELELRDAHIWLDRERDSEITSGSAALESGNMYTRNQYNETSYILLNVVSFF